MQQKDAEGGLGRRRKGRAGCVCVCVRGADIRLESGGAEADTTKGAKRSKGSGEEAAG